MVKNILFGFFISLFLSSVLLGNIYNLNKSPYAADVARDLGDILTIIVDESAVTKNRGSTDENKGYGSDFGLKELFFPSLNISKGLTASSGSGDEPGFDFKFNKERKFGASRSSQHQFNTRLQVRIVEKIGDDQYLVQGNRAIHINGKDTKIFVSGILREKDISVNNTAFSYCLADAIIEIDDEIVTKDGSPGILGKILDFFL